MDTSFVQAGIFTVVLTSLQGPISESGLLSLNISVFSRLAAREVSPGEIPQAKRPWRPEAERDGCFRRLLCLIVEKFG